MRILVFISISFIFVSKGFCSNSIYTTDKFYFERITSSDGLSSDEVRQVYQDKDGFLWFCTSDGLIRYDGYTFKIYKPVYNEHESFSSKDFTCIQEDDRGRLWVGTKSHGVNIFNKYSGKVETTGRNQDSKLSLNRNSVHTICLDKNGNIWIGAANGLSKYNLDTDSLERINRIMIREKNITIVNVHGIIMDSKGDIWIGTWNNGLIKYESQTGKYYQYEVGKASDEGDMTVRSLFFDSREKLWVGLWDRGLLRVDSISNGELYYKRFLYKPDNTNSISGNIILSISQDKFENIWIGTPYGLDIIQNPYDDDPKVIRKQALKESSNHPSGNVVYSIFRDNSDIMWLGTLGGGINKVDFEVKKFDYFLIPEVDPQRKSQTVQSFIEIEKDVYLIGVKSLGFFKFDRRNSEFQHFLQHSLYKKIKHYANDINTANCFLIDHQNNLWIGSRYNGLFIINEEQGTIKRIYRHSENNFTIRQVNCLFEDSRKNLWVGTNFGLYKFIYNPTKEDYHIYRYRWRDNDANSISGNYINVVYEDKMGNIWIGTNENGLNKVINKDDNGKQLTFQSYRVEKENPTSLNSNDIYSIHEDHDSNLWIGTGGGGLNRCIRENGTFVHYTGKEGLSGDAVYDILGNTNGDLWLSTNKGLSRFNYKGKLGEQFDNFTVEDGLQSNIFIKGASMKTQNGELFFGGHHGFNIFDPDQIKTNSFIPPVLVTEFMVFNTSYYSRIKDNQITLTYKDYNFSLEFTALSFSQPLKNKFTYMLKGFDPQDNGWHYTSAENRIVHYSNLKSGEYIFMVKAANSSGLWNDEPYKLYIKVKPAPYKTWWAYLIYTIVFVGTLFIIYRFLISRTKIKQALEIEQIERGKSEKLNQFKLRFFTNISHELLTPLSILSCTAEDIKAGDSFSQSTITMFRKNIDRLVRLINQLLIFRKIETGNLELAISKNDIAEFIRNLAANFQPLARKKNITFNINTASRSFEAYFDGDKIDKILHNLLSNAFKYTPDGGSVNVICQKKIVDSNEYAEIIVQDTGRGIPADKLDYIFDRFTRLEYKGTSGSGIGLELTKNLVELHNGELFVESELNENTEFRFRIPVFKEAYLEDQIVDKPIQLERFEASDPEILFSDDAISNDLDINDELDETRDSLLIVEDNVDFRRVLINHLKKYYIVHEAENGKEAFEIARQKVPSIIVSDVMMPEMDGIELCKKIKSTLEISHIPVLLLTAKVNVESRTEGYDVGADSYISKPVNLKMLRTRVASLIEQRRKIKELFKEKIDLEPSRITITSLDEKFITRAKDIVEKNIDNPNFSVNEFIKEMGTSNSMLYRKLNSITGLNPSEFIRNIRLKRAAQILKEQKFSISEVAYLTGFNDQSYFGVCFKKEFGKSPTEFLNQLKK